KSVMEFLLINHPLDCPICDQGGECQLQDLAVGYGGNSSRYEEDKRVVFHKDVGPLISMEEMSRCIHCTRCVRFGQEIAGSMELGMSYRGEHSEIETFVGETVDSELSGNMIDICPVGALTSKPFRYQARTWELSRRKSISPHDATGANLVVQVKNNQVMRVVPFDNEEVNECWIADRDRFSYEALNGPNRLTQPMLKQDGQWHVVDWTTALEYVVNGVNQIKADHGAEKLGCLASPHSTLEELDLAARFMRALGSDNIDSRLRAAEFTAGKPVRWLGRSLASLNSLDRALVVGSHLRKDHPLMAQRIRQAARRGAHILALSDAEPDWAMQLQQSWVVDSAVWVQSLADIAASIAKQLGIEAPANGDPASAHAAAHHAKASSLLSLANWIAHQTNASVGYLGEAANTVGAQLVKAQPVQGGKHTAQMLQDKSLQALFLMHTEPEFDCAGGPEAMTHLGQVGMVVTMSPFLTNMDISDVLLPISPFTETAGTFVNTEGRAQSFHGVVRPLAQTRPAWKVWRVLGTMLNLPRFDFQSIEEVRAQAIPPDIPSKLSNACDSPVDLTPALIAPVTASIYQLDALVRRAPALQHTADAREGLHG
ncbi:MAG: NADH dehydrogenase (quinone) subunit G, partial [Betaproteobacteria bacterium]|nr:NADH dehydrogenase (quinone) subunit G [Betaproteobacteria bacterium]